MAPEGKRFLETPCGAYGGFRSDLKPDEDARVEDEERDVACLGNWDSFFPLCGSGGEGSGENSRSSSSSTRASGVEVELMHVGQKGCFCRNDTGEDTSDVR